MQSVGVAAIDGNVIESLPMSRIDNLITEAIAPGTARHLALDRLVINPRLARRLPSAVAFRYHALPVAEDNSYTTVAMADPDDATARAAIAAALGTKLYVVQADPAAIDGLLAETWPEASQRALRLLVYRQDNSANGEVCAYAEYLSHMLDGNLTQFRTVAPPGASFDDKFGEAGQGYDLVVLGEPDRCAVEHLLASLATFGSAQSMPTSLLIALRPRWPLKHILLVTRGYETDDAAVDWITRLVQSSRAAVTVLAVVPEMTNTMSNQATRLQCGLADWLATDTALGQQLRRIAQRLANWETVGTLHFRQGPPGQQIRSEVTEEDYDLIVVADDHSSRWLRELMAEPLPDLLSWIDRPVMIVRSTIS
jgi:nucleotide-binding universal stress UspA family protein